MKYTDGRNIVDAYKWSGNVLAGGEKGTPQWLGDAILITHKIWFDAAWNMKVDTADGVKVCDVGDYVVNRNGVLSVIPHDEFKDSYTKA